MITICKQIIFKFNKKSTKKKCKDKLKTSKWDDRHCCGISIAKQKFVCRVDVPLIFKNFKRRKKVNNKCKK